MTFIKKYLITFIYFIRLIFFEVSRKNGRMFLYKLHRNFQTFYYPPIRKELPETYLDQIFKITGTIELTEPVSVQGNVTAYEQVVLNYFVNLKKPRIIFEIGTFDGRSTLNFAINSSPGTTIYTLDLNKNINSSATHRVDDSDQRLINTNVTGERFLSEEGKTLSNHVEIKQLLGDTAHFDFSPYYNKIDFVFVDAAHTYDYVKNESKQALKLLKKEGGVILWHDYDDKHQGSIQAINELYKANPEWKMFHIADTNIACLIKD